MNYNQSHENNINSLVAGWDVVGLALIAIKALDNIYSWWRKRVFQRWEWLEEKILYVRVNNKNNTLLDLKIVRKYPRLTWRTAAVTRLRLMTGLLVGRVDERGRRAGSDDQKNCDPLEHHCGDSSDLIEILRIDWYLSDTETGNAFNTGSVKTRPRSA